MLRQRTSWDLIWLALSGSSVWPCHESNLMYTLPASCHNSKRPQCPNQLEINRIPLHWLDCHPEYRLKTRWHVWQPCGTLRERHRPLYQRQDFFFPEEARKWTLISRWGGKNWALHELYQDSRGSSRVEMGMLETSGVASRVSKTFRGSRRKVGFPSRRCSGKGPHLPLRGKSHGVSRVSTGNWGSSQVTMETSGTHSCCLRKVQSPCELWEASLDSSPVGAGAEVLNWSWGQNLGIPLQCWHGSWGSYGVSAMMSVLVSSGDMQVRFPLEL